MKKIGYQGEENCYTFNVIKKNLDESFEPIKYKTFNKVFEDLNNDLLDFIMIPIENSTGGSIYINYDMFYKYNIIIHHELTLQINHTLYCNTSANKDDLKYILSHPQAIAQCTNNIKSNNWEQINSWDTTGSIYDMKEKGNLYGSIAPPGMEKIIDNIKPLIKNFNDDKVNITRFYMISKNNIYNFKFNNNDHCKFSSYIILQDQIGALRIILNKFYSNNINLTKIESRPLEGRPFNYIFFIEGIGKYLDVNKLKYIINSIKILGIFPTKMNKINLNLVEHNLNIGIVGFGRFGQFIGKELSYYGFNVCCTSRKDYSNICKNIGIKYLSFDNFIKEKVDIVILATSILSFEDVVKKFDKSYWKDKIVTDVLSVKEYPFSIMKKYIGTNILLTHPMFGPDSAKYSWKNKKFVYWFHNIFYDKTNIINQYLDFWKKKGCSLIELQPIQHDLITANSQLITHFVGRSIPDFKFEANDISTDGFKSLLNIKEHSKNDSFDLFKALAIKNNYSKKCIHLFLYNIYNLYNTLYPSGLKESATASMFSKLENTNIINCAAGVPSWKPDVIGPCEYATSKGNKTLIQEIVNYYNKNNININTNEVIITSGAKPSLYMSILHLTKPFTKWLVPIPYWVSYNDLIKLCKGVPINIKSDIENNWEPKLSEIESKFKDDLVNGIIISNPNNPTGLSYSKEWIDNLIKLCIKYDKYLISDEVYAPLVSNKSIYTNYEKQIIVNSFSKGWGIPGFRVGWIIANENIIKNIIKIQSTIVTCAPSNNQDTAIKLLQNHYKPNLDLLEKCNHEFYDLFTKKGWKLCKNNNTTLYHFPYKENENIDKIIQKLFDNGLAVIHGKSFGIENAFRITLWNNIDKIEKIKNILNDVL